MEIDFNEVKDFKETETYKLLKKQIAMTHGCTISDDDPILMFVTLNEFMLKQYQEAFDNVLGEYSDIVFNTKTDINNYIKENELALFKRIQEINNKNVETVHAEIKKYFNQEAEAYFKLKTKIEHSNKYLNTVVLINVIISAILTIIVIIK